MPKLKVLFPLAEEFPPPNPEDAFWFCPLLPRLNMPVPDPPNNPPLLFAVEDVLVFSWFVPFDNAFVWLGAVLFPPNGDELALPNPKVLVFEVLKGEEALLPLIEVFWADVKEELVEFNGVFWGLVLVWREKGEEDGCWGWPMLPKLGLEKAELVGFLPVPFM